MQVFWVGFVGEIHSREVIQKYYEPDLLKSIATNHEIPKIEEKEVVPIELSLTKFHHPADANGQLPCKLISIKVESACDRTETRVER